MKIKKIIFALLLFLTILTIYLSISEFLGSKICLTNLTDSAKCSNVQNTSYGKILGIKVNYLGAVAITLLFLIFLFANSKNKYKQNFYEVYILGTIIGTIGAIYFLSIQFFILKAICSSCLIVDFGTILISVLSWINHKNRN